MEQWIVGTAICIAGAIAACGHAGTTGENNNSDCQPKVWGIIIYPDGVDLQVRDPFGRGQAIGTTVVFRASDGGTQQGFAKDTLHIGGENNRTGTFSATISRPYYRDQTIRNIKSTPNGCSVNTAEVPVTLQLAPGAPPLRSLIILGADGLYAPGVQVHLVPHLDANPDVSTAVTWTVSDATLASVDANGVVTAKCSKDGGTVKVTATAVYDGTTSAFVNMGVAPAANCP
jgi:hypothetical protein